MTALRRLAPSQATGATWALSMFVLFAVSAYVIAQLSLAAFAVEPAPHDWPDNRLLDPFTRWDTGWYYAIAERGYYYDGPGKQSAVAFFPAYPAAMRLVAVVVRNTIAAGVLVTLVCGAGVAVLFHRWCAAFVGPRVGRLALVLFLTYPFAFYLFGAVYSDALFLVAVLGAFCLLERGHPVLAGLVGIAATAARPVGVALVVALVLRALEIRGVLPGSRPAAFGADSEGGGDGETPASRSRIRLVPRRMDLRALRPADAGVLLSALGFLGFCVLLWARFGEPLAFTKVGTSAGWYKAMNLETAAKLHFFRLLRGYGLNLATFWLTVQGVFAVVSLALVPAVVRRFGWAYGAYVAIAVGLAFASTPDFIGMGRYVLAGFPSFAAAADLLLQRDRRRLLPAVACGVHAVLLIWMVHLFARWYFFS